MVLKWGAASPMIDQILDNLNYVSFKLSVIKYMIYKNATCMPELTEHFIKFVFV